MNKFLIFIKSFFKAQITEKTVLKELYAQNGIISIRVVMVLWGQKAGGIVKISEDLYEEEIIREKYLNQEIEKNITNLKKQILQKIKNNIIGVFKCTSQ